MSQVNNVRCRDHQLIVFLSTSAFRSTVIVLVILDVLGRVPRSLGFLFLSQMFLAAVVKTDHFMLCINHSGSMV